MCANFLEGIFIYNTEGDVDKATPTETAGGTSVHVGAHAHTHTNSCLLWACGAAGECLQGAGVTVCALWMPTPCRPPEGMCLLTRSPHPTTRCSSRRAYPEGPPACPACSGYLMSWRLLRAETAKRKGFEISGGKTLFQQAMVSRRRCGGVTEF